MWPFRRRTRAVKRNPRPYWFKWVLLAFISYGLFLGAQPDSPDKPNLLRSAINKAGNDIKNQPMLNLEGYKNVIFPDEIAGIGIKEIEEGKGSPVVCGQKVAIAYQAYLAQGNELPDHATADKPLHFTVGESATLPAFEQGVIGMRQGGKRSVVAPAVMAYGLNQFKRDDIPKSANTRFEIELVSATPEIPDANTSPYRIAEVTNGDGAAVSCGTQVSTAITIWNAKGKQLYQRRDKENPIIFTPGKSEIMLGIEQGVIGMRVGGARFLVIPPDFQKTMNGNAPKLTFPVPNDEVLLVEVVALY